MIKKKEKYAHAASGRTCSTKLPPEQVVEHSDQGRWFQEKPTSLSPLPVRWMGTLNLYRIPWFGSWRRTCGRQKLVRTEGRARGKHPQRAFLVFIPVFPLSIASSLHLSLRNSLFTATLKWQTVTFLFVLWIQQMRALRQKKNSQVADHKAQRHKVTAGLCRGGQNEVGGSL